jgi:hypothetical protein
MKYTFSVEATITLCTEVEADSLEEAVAKAQDRGVQSLCHQCADGHYPTRWSLTGELDCEPAVMPLSDVDCDGESVDMSRAHELWG